MVERILGRSSSAEPGPSLIVVGGIHGNEPAGVRAAERVVAQLSALPIRGDVLALAGNVKALAENRRYLSRDLNRLWSAERLAEPLDDAESEELRELHMSLEGALARARGPIYFLDLHTTSARGVPFALSRDTPRHPIFAANFPLPVILGLEEQVPGVLSGWMTSRGCVTLSVEGGQHQSDDAQANLEAVIWIAAWASGLCAREHLPALPGALERLRVARGELPASIEVLFRHAITPEDEFRMEPGFANIQRTRAGDLLARDRRGEIRAPSDGMILLPLYQPLGEDGFFFGREIFSPPRTS